jgi:osmoprotectant transport system permease protein
MAEGHGMSLLLASFPDDFTNAIDFLLHERESVSGQTKIGGHELIHLAANHLALSAAAVGLAAAVAIPLGIYLGHYNKGEFAAINASNAGRAIPTLVLLAVFVAYMGVGFVPIMLSLALLALPPMLTNTFVGTRQVDRDSIDAARGMGMTEAQLMRRVELPLALPIIFAGLRVASINVVATATIAPLGSVDSLGTPIISDNVYGADGRLGAAIAVTVMTLAISGALVLLQRAVTPRGLKLATDSPRRRGPVSFLRRREAATP